MKIDGVSSSNLINNYKEITSQRAQTTDISAVSDRVELSDDAKSFASVINEVKKSLYADGDIKSSRFDEVANQIKEGTYQMDSSKLADKLLGNYIDIEA